MPVDMKLLLVASLLKRGQGIDRLLTALTILAMAMGLYGVLLASASFAFKAGMAVLVLLGLAQSFHAQRVALDAELFAVLARTRSSLDDLAAQLDRALSECLALPPEKAGRSWEERSQGALRLFRRQVLLCATQWLFALGCLITLNFDV